MKIAPKRRVETRKIGQIIILIVENFFGQMEKYIIITYYQCVNNTGAKSISCVFDRHKLAVSSRLLFGFSQFRA